MLIHAYRRKEAIQVDLGAIVIEFKPDADRKGAVVAEVADEAHVATLLNISEAYVPFEGAAKPAKAAKTANTPAGPTADEIAAAAAAEAAKKAGGSGEEKPFLLKGDKPEDDVDLGAMDEEALTAFAKLNKITIHSTWKGDVDKIRQKLFERFGE
ncbi:MAG: hypothetical protein V4614_14905 [Pseudomonadota bacterium]